jgi:sterol desaturase/sphingolipid hydroxylase (fatty acid hydroxylase superfamily)
MAGMEPETQRAAKSTTGEGVQGGTDSTILVDHYGIDIARPLFAQITNLGDRYWEWVHSSVSPKTMARRAAMCPGAWGGSLRIFSSDVLESMTHMQWWLVLVLWVPVSVVLLAGALFGLDMPLGQLVGWFAIGFFVWTLVEYILHRVIFHYEPHSALGRKIHFLFHGIHHLDPWDATRLVFPPVLGLAFGIVLFSLVRLLLPLDTSLAAMAGLIAGYLSYDMSHYYSHHVKPGNRWGKYLRRYHLAHHHKEQHRLFGVSQPFWDIVFRTGER